jgi:hypothetical protein
VVVLVVALAVIAFVHALRLEHRVQGLPSTIQTAENAAETGHLAAAQAVLQAAQNTLTSVNSTLYNSLDFDLIHVLPVARQNLDAIRQSVTLGLQMVGGGEQILHAASSLEASNGRLDIPLRGGQIPLATTQAVGAAIAQVITNLPLVAVPPRQSFLVGGVRSLESRVYAEAAKRRQQLQSVGTAIQLIDDIAGASGSRRYLIAVGNSAEMRGSGGMILSYGVLTSANGKVTLEHFGPIDELALSHAETQASFPADFVDQDGYLAPTLLWRNANLMSDLTVDAPVLEAMYTQATGHPVDGVIQVDPAGLGAILAGIGPVQTADLGTVTSANVVPVTLSQAYFLYENRPQRQDYTEEAAQAAFAKLTTGDFSALRPLGTALVDAGKARHVLMYANDTTDESLVRTLGFDGSLPTPSSGFTQLTVQNFGGNKLDYYLHSSVSLTGKPPSPSGSAITATIDLANAAPAGQSVPTEVFGPAYSGEVAGEYVGLVTLYLPTNTYLQTSQTDTSVTTGPDLGSQNGAATVTYTVAIPAGGSSHVVLHLLLPPLPSHTKSLAVIPAPRVISTIFTQKYT